VAFGAPCFFGVGVGDGDISGVAVGDGDGVSDGDTDGVSNGCGDGELLFFRCGEALGDGVGVGDLFFFFGVGDGNSSVADGVGFFFGEEVADGAGDSSSRGDEDFFGVGVGVGDFILVATALFFFRGLGVGVGVEKTFFSAAPRDCSAAGAGAMVETTRASAITILINMPMV